MTAARRDRRIDALKGTAILLVLLGHAVQYARGPVTGGDPWFFHDPLFQGIYMFHMPLFALLSGFVCTGAMRRSLRELLVTQLHRLIVPTLIWSAIYSLARWGATGSCSLRLFTYWYIWTIVGSSLLLWFVLRSVPAGYRTAAVVALCLGSLLLPGGAMLKFLFPFYALGYAWAQHKPIAQRRWTLMLLGGTAFGICYALWTPGTYVYLGESWLFGAAPAVELSNYLLRFAAGAAGSAVTVGLLYGARESGLRLLARTGGLTFGIYMVQHILYSFVVPHCAPLWRTLPDGAYHAAVVPAVTLAVLLASLGAVRLLKSSPATARWMLGEKPQAQQPAAPQQ